MIINERIVNMGERNQMKINKRKRGIEKEKTNVLCYITILSNSVFPSPPATGGFFASTNTYPISSAHICNMTTSFFCSSFFLFLFFSCVSLVYLIYIQSSSVQLDLNGTRQLLDGSTLCVVDL